VNDNDDDDEYDDDEGPQPAGEDDAAEPPDEATEQQPPQQPQAPVSLLDQAADLQKHRQIKNDKRWHARKKKRVSS
jgi:hypothetical protein